MQVFLSYSRADWGGAPKAYDAFYNSLKALLRPAFLGKEVVVYRDKIHIPQDEQWPSELAKAIEESSAFLFLLSPSWLSSANCWKEFRHAKNHMGHEKLVPVLLKPDSWREADVPNGFKPDFSGLQSWFDLIQSPYFKGDFDEQLTHILTFDSEATQQAKLKEFLSPLVKSIRKAASTTAPAPVPVPAAPAPTIRQSESLVLTINNRRVRFVQVPEGDLGVPERMAEHHVPGPFHVMAEPTTIEDLTGSQAAANDSVGNLALAGRCMHLTARNLTLPNEDEWEWMMKAGFDLDGQTLAPRISTLAGTVNAWGITVPQSGQRELVRGPWFDRRQALAGKALSADGDVIHKWIEADQFGRQRIRNDRPIGRQLFRLVLRS